MISRVANRYAKSLFLLAREQGEVDRAVGDMSLIAETIENSHDLLVLLKSPVVRADKKQAVLDAVFKKSLGKTVQAFVEILVRKGREGILPGIARAFAIQFQKANNISEVYITSAIELTEAQKNEIKSYLSQQDAKQKYKLIETIDEQIKGGIIVRIDDQQIDASVTRRLNDIEKELTTDDYVIKY